MIKNIFNLALLSLLMSVNIVTAQNDSTLQILIDEAIRISPRIKQHYSKLYAANSEIEIGTNLPDPTLTLGLVNLPTNSFSFTQEPMTGKIIGLNQSIPFPGALSAASDVKAVDTLIVQQEIEDLKNQISKEVADLYYELLLVRGKRELAFESKSLLKQISEVAKSNYEVAKSSLNNVIQVEVQITRIIDKIEQLNGTEASLVSELNALLLRDEQTEIETETIPQINNYQYQTESLVSLSKENRPFLKGIEYSEQKTKLMEKQAGYDFYPNFKLGLQYSQRDYIQSSSMDLNDLFSVVVGISLPINYGGNKTAKVEKAKYLQTLTREYYNSSIQSLEQSFGRITSKINELKVREQLIVESLLPQSEQALKAALADYQVAKIDFVNVMKSENDILKIKTDLISIRTNYYLNINQLEFLTGHKN